ncbi:MAG TPA: UbiD family decarboxylase [Steroidobacteraceae bacterium]
MESTNKVPIKDLRDWMSRAEALGEMLTVTEPADRDEEMSAICYLAAKQPASPAIIFDNPKGFENSQIGARLLWNLYGPSIRRVALSLEEDPETPTVELIRRTKDKMKVRLEPVEVERDDAPIFQNSVFGEDVDLDALPIPRHWPLDGGRYAGTGDAVITRDPQTGRLNVGTYRMMVQGKRQTGLYLSPGKDALLHITKSWAEGKPLHVAAAWGVDPILMMVGSTSYPKDVSEYECAGGLKGSPIRVVRAKNSDLLIPADAELVVEGIIEPGAMKSEGPFGEFSGYYGKPAATCPLVEITAIHFRNRPVLTNALMADYPSCEQSGFFSILRSAKIWDDLDKLGIVGITGVYCHPAAVSGIGMTVISVAQQYAGHAAQVLSLAGQVPGGAFYTKWIIAVDDDVDPTDMNQVIWAMASRANPIDDIDIIRNTWSTTLDPSQNPPEKRPYGSKALINACKDYRAISSFSKRTALRRSVYDYVVARWSEFGLPGSPALPLFFEQGTNNLDNESKKPG